MTPPRIGPYQILAEVARGGMGVVYRARHPRLGRDVAVKVLLAAASPTARERFLREGRLLARLRHPNIVPVHDGGEEGGLPFLVMDLAPGESLGDRLAREGPLAPREAVEVMVPVARAIAASHAAGVLHRDLKPDNLLAGPSGEPLVGDFGIAKDVGPDAAESMSRSGQFIGTPGFWPPEQARGDRQQIGPASDVYGLGATLFALLTGEAPFERGSFLEVLRATIDEPPRAPSTLQPAVDAGLDAIVLRCLEKEPGARFASAEELAAALEAWSRPRRARRAGPRPDAAGAAPGSRGALLGVGGLALTCAIVGGVATWRSGAAQAELTARLGHERARADHAEQGLAQAERDARARLAETEQRVADLSLEAAEFTVERAGHAAASARTEVTLAVQRARALLEAGRWGAARDEAARALAASRAAGTATSPAEVVAWAAWRRAPPPLITTRLEIPAAALPVAMRPDGGILAIGDTKVSLHDLSSGARVGELGSTKQGVSALAWSPDGRRLVVAGRAGELSCWDVDGSQVLWETVTPERKRLDVSPDGRQVRCGAIGELTVLALETGEVLRTLAVPVEGAHNLAWTRGLERVLVTAEGNVGTVFDGATGAVIASTIRALHSATLDPSGQFVVSGDRWERVDGGPAWAMPWSGWGGISATSADETRGIITRSRGLSVWDLVARERVSAPSFPAGQHAWAPQLSADGRLCSAGASPRGDLFDLSVWRVDGAPWARTIDAHDGGAWVTAVAVSADGRIVASGSRDRTIRLWDTATGLSLGPLGEHRGTVYGLAFLPDGRLASCGADGAVLLWDVTARTARKLEGHSAQVLALAVSADGTRLLSGGADPMALLWDVDKGSWLTKLTHGGTMRALAFSPDGRTALSGGDDDQLRIWDLAAGKARSTIDADPRVTGTEAGIGCVAVSPDGTTALCGDGSSTGSFQLRRFDLATGARRAPLDGHEGGVLCVAVAPDGGVVFSGGLDQTLRAWDAASGDDLGVLVRAGAQVLSVARDAAGRVVVAGDAAGKVHVCDLGAVGLPDAAPTSARPDDARALAERGAWYAAHHEWRWARSALERARERGADVSSLLLVHCLWATGDRALARAELLSARRSGKTAEVSDSYVSLLRRTLDAP